MAILTPAWQRQPMFSAQTNKRLGRFTLLIVAGYFLIGFWPFDFRPRNHVRWLAGQTGLQFEPYGIVYDPLAPAASEAARSSPAIFTIELWLQAQHEPANDVFDILTIHNPRLPHDFTLCQWKQDFLLRASTLSPPKSRRIPEIGLDDALVEGRSPFITVSGNKAGTAFYLDGKSAGTVPGFLLNAEALDGQLILGNDDSGQHSWAGRILGLAVYDQALDETEIARHFALWTQGRAEQLARTTGLQALYVFNENHGDVARDQSENGHHLIIPADFHPLRRALLIPPWQDLSYRHPDYSDIAINILGFLPFGFCFFCYCRSQKPNSWVTNLLLVILTGVAISLIIETVQAWLPNRTSSQMDVLTNAVGTVLGAILALAVQPAPGIQSVIRKKF